MAEEFFDYKIPSEYKAKMTEKFIKTMHFELHKISGISLEDTTHDLTFVAGTSAWYCAFGMTCIETNNLDLLKYYNGLPWYDSDLFDGEVEDLFVKYGLIIDKTIDDIIVENTSFKHKEMGSCINCGKIYPIKWMSIYKDEEGILEGYYECNYCKIQRDSENKSANKYYQYALKRVEEESN